VTNLRKLHPNWNGAYRATLDRYGLRCYWCGEKLIDLEAFQPKANIIKIGHKTITFYDNLLVEHTRYKLTFDHVYPKAKGGRYRDNLVPSCVPCNKARADFMCWMKNDPSKGKHRKQAAQLAKRWSMKIRKWWDIKRSHSPKRKVFLSRYWMMFSNQELLYRNK